jgi:hypothetical protein
MGYDVDMIRDFIEHLTWSLRVDHFEWTSGHKAFNQELDAQLARCARKRSVPRLVSQFSLEKDKPELTNQEMQEARRQFSTYMAKRRDEQLGHLEALKDLLDEACAHASGKIFEITAPGSRVLDGSWFQGQDGEKADD